MKYLIYSFLIFSLLGCKNFLDEVSSDLLRPTKVNHYASLMLNECTLEAPYFEGVHHMTDDITEDALAKTKNKEGLQTIYTWRREIEIDENGERQSVNEAWADFYRVIAILNDILLEIRDDAGTPEEIAYIKGEAYFLRAHAYFHLVNLYALPYVPETAKGQLGVPLRLDHAVEVTYDRADLESCYDQIEKDLLNGCAELKKTNLVKSVWHPNLAACELLLSRVKLFRHQWEDAINYASQVIEEIPLTKLSNKEPFVKASNPEIIYSFMYEKGELSIRDMEATGYGMSADLLACYDPANDIRYTACFKLQGGAQKTVIYSTKMEETYSELGAFNLRGAEAYLNRAEAYVMINDLDAAKSDLKALIAKRYYKPELVVLPDTQDELLEFIFNERRREFAWEDHYRWYDLRRMAKRPEIKHIFTYVNDEGFRSGQVAYRLLKNDANYVLPIPLTERDNNPLIINNDRLEKIAEYVN